MNLIKPVIALVAVLGLTACETATEDTAMMKKDGDAMMSDGKAMAHEGDAMKEMAK